MLAGAISFLVNAINAINSFDHRRIMPLPLSMPSMPSTALSSPHHAPPASASITALFPKWNSLLPPPCSTSEQPFTQFFTNPYQILAAYSHRVSMYFTVIKYTAN
jgi:hypothetical protein